MTDFRRRIRIAHMPKTICTTGVSRDRGPRFRRPVFSLESGRNAGHGRTRGKSMDRTPPHLDAPGHRTRTRSTARRAVARGAAPRRRPATACRRSRWPDSPAWSRTRSSRRWCASSGRRAAPVPAVPAAGRHARSTPPNSRASAWPVRVQPAARTYVEALRAQGVSLESLYLDLLAGAARRLGEWWASDLCDFADVTVGVGRLQQILRELSPEFRAELECAPERPSSVARAGAGRAAYVRPFHCHRFLRARRMGRLGRAVGARRGDGPAGARRVVRRGRACRWAAKRASRA